jgi:hypothetical protein
MIRVDLIINDFMDLRSYVSHTLLLHRLTLGVMSTPETARITLQDASIWPLVPREIIRFCDLTPTLYGLVSKNLDDIIKDIRILADNLRNARDDLVVKHQDTAQSRFLDIIRIDLHEKFVKIRDVWDKETPDFSEKSSRSATKGLKSQEWLLKLRHRFSNEFAPLMSKFARAANNPGIPSEYNIFWKNIEDLYVMTRFALVAAALSNERTEIFQEIRKLQVFIRKLEVIVSCWNSKVLPEERDWTLREELNNINLSSMIELVSLIRQEGDEK